MVKALFYRRRGSRLPEAYEAAGFRGVGRDLAEETRRFLAPLINTQPVSVGRVFSYWVSFDAGDPNVSVWLMLFYRRVVFMCFTLPRGLRNA